MRVGIQLVAKTAGRVAAPHLLSGCIRDFLLRSILVLVGCLLYASIDTPFTGVLRAAGVNPVGFKAGRQQSLISIYGTPNVHPDLVKHLERYNITKVHAAGVKVDLSHRKPVDGQMYSEVGGSCPVYGKYIELYQPLKAPYKNDFLQDVPSEAEHKKQGNPMPGGFGMTMVAASKERFSPMPLSRLEGAPAIITARTSLGKCAQYAYQTYALSPTTMEKTDYRFPFVWDPSKKLCYLLYISMQEMMGNRYCSMHGDSDVNWYCFQPKKDPSKNSHLVYGSAYVGKDPEYYVDNCPQQALAGQKFGVWEAGKCRDYTTYEDSLKQEVPNKEACWAFAFNNPKSASDQPQGYSARADNPWVNWLPYRNSQWPLSGGKGYNYAVYFIDRRDVRQCVVSSREPGCLITDSRAVSYTSLGGLEENTIDYQSPLIEAVEHYTACNYESCTRVWTSEEDGVVTQKEEVPCTKEDSKNCAQETVGNGLLIGGMIALGVLLAAGAAGGFFYFRKKKVPPANVNGSSSMQDITFGEEEKRKRTRQSDLMQEAEPSFWDEADDQGDEGQTTVVVEGNY